mmetsp:Transcript_115367/g.299067  ORF Transcript_115367/g.299067 Transcript_115367/m.299067 type:complete len:228 (-) Transcript_115367:51-734(-)
MGASGAALPLATASTSSTAPENSAASKRPSPSSSMTRKAASATRLRSLLVASACASGAAAAAAADASPLPRLPYQVRVRSIILCSAQRNSIGVMTPVASAYTAKTVLAACVKAPKSQGRRRSSRHGLFKRPEPPLRCASSSAPDVVGGGGGGPTRAWKSCSNACCRSLLSGARACICGTKPKPTPTSVTAPVAVQTFLATLAVSRAARSGLDTTAAPATAATTDIAP